MLKNGILYNMVIISDKLMFTEMQNILDFIFDVVEY